MKQIELPHERIFTSPEFVKHYYNAHKKHMGMIGKKIAKSLIKYGFREGRIIDVGCGFGIMAVEIAKAIPGVKITGIDLSQPLLEIANSLAKEAGVSDRVVFQKGDVQKIEFADDSFDIAINTFIIHIVENPLAMLNEIERVVKPEGRIFIMDLRRCWPGLIAQDIRKANTRQEAENIFQDSSIRVGKFGSGLFWWNYQAGR